MTDRFDSYVVLQLERYIMSKLCRDGTVTNFNETSIWLRLEDEGFEHLQIVIEGKDKVAEKTVAKILKLWNENYD